VAHRQGVGFVVAAIWPGTTGDETRLRALSGADLCLVCQAFDPAHLWPLRSYL
jgi:hypothetical protein